MYQSKMQETVKLQGSEKATSTADSSPWPTQTQFKCRSLKQTGLSLNSSFQINLEDIHVEAVWNASLQFLKDSIDETIDLKQGFNNITLFPELSEQTHEKQYEDHELEISKIIQNKNSLINIKESIQLIVDFRNEKDLTNLLLELHKKFHFKIFAECLLIIKQAWQGYLQFKQKTKISKQWNQFFVPRFFSLDQENINKSKPKSRYQDLTPEILIRNADELSQRISHDLYIEPKISFLNLREVNLSRNLKKNNRIINVNFQQFIKSIVRAIFFCLQGVYFSLGSTNINKSFLSIGESRSYWQDDHDVLPSFGSIRKLHQ